MWKSWNGRDWSRQTQAAFLKLKSTQCCNSIFTTTPAVWKGKIGINNEFQELKYGSTFLHMICSLLRASNRTVSIGLTKFVFAGSYAINMFGEVGSNMIKKRIKDEIDSFASGQFSHWHEIAVP